MKITESEWNPRHTGGRRKSELRQTIESMQVGETLRISHEGRRCKLHSCSAERLLSRIKKATGARYKSYHEKRHVMVVLCLATKENTNE